MWKDMQYIKSIQGTTILPNDHEPSRDLQLVFTNLQEVEPMAKESDQIHIIALTDALGVCVRVVYMDRGGNSSVNHHDFPEDGDQPLVNLLYRPGHYDILYQKL